MNFFNKAAGTDECSMKVKIYIVLTVNLYT